MIPTTQQSKTEVLCHDCVQHQSADGTCRNQTLCKTGQVGIFIIWSCCFFLTIIMNYVTAASNWKIQNGMTPFAVDEVITKLNL